MAPYNAFRPSPAIVAFVSQKGGVGKSTLARTLALVAVSAGLVARLADLGVQQRTLLLWGNTRKGNGHLPAVAVEAFSDAGEALVTARSGELMILDTPGQVKDATLHLVRRAHLVVQPTGPSLDDLRPAVLVFHALANLGIPRERLAFALCRTMAKGEEDAARAHLEEAGFAVLPGAIPERVAYRTALNCGLALTETDEGALNKRADSLLRAVLAKLAPVARIPAPPPDGENAPGPAVGRRRAAPLRWAVAPPAEMGGKS